MVSTSILNWLREGHYQTLLLGEKRVHSSAAYSDDAPCGADGIFFADAEAKSGSESWNRFQILSWSHEAQT